MEYERPDPTPLSSILDAPTPSFPYLVSSTTYQAVILPKGYQIGSYEKTKFPGTGPYKLQSYTPGVRATFVRNDAYWGGPQAFDQVVMTFYNDSQSQILALQGGQLDLIPQFGYQEGRPLFNNKALQVFRQKSSVHREIPMAVDSAAWKDRRVRVAMALLLNRPSIIKTLFGGIASLGNDSPFAPNMLATNTSVPQRKQDVARAKALLQAAGVSSLDTTLTTYRAYELPDLAVLVKNAAKLGGIDLTLDIQTGGRVLRRAADRRPRRNPVAQRPDDDHRLGPTGGAQRLPRLVLQVRRRLERLAHREQEP